MDYTDKFGIIPTPSTLIFKQGRIFPVDSFSQVLEEVIAHSHHEGYLYPPRIHREKGKLESFDEMTGEYNEYEVVPNSERPSPVQFLPVTHHLEIYEEYSAGGRDQIGSFIIHLVGFLYGVRTQFHDWKVDGRALFRGRPDFHASPASAGKCITRSIEVWSNWSENDKMRMTNILYLYTKAISEEYEWLEFTLLYLVFDACYKLAQTQHGVSAKRHSERIDQVASHFGIIEEPDLFEQWSELRNDLFHEALWRGKQVGNPTFSDVYHSILYFHAFISRLIVALIGCETDYIRSSWRHLGMVCFD